MLDGPTIGAVVRLRTGDTAAAAALAGLAAEAPKQPRSVSAWQSFYAAISGNPNATLEQSTRQVAEGRTYGPQHELAVLEARVTLGDWDAVLAMLAHARARTSGNALLGPWCDRAEGMAAALSGKHTRPGRA